MTLRRGRIEHHISPLRSSCVLLPVVSVAFLQATWQRPHSSLWVLCLALCGPVERAAPPSPFPCLLLNLSLWRDSSIDTHLSCRPRSPSLWPCHLMVPQSPLYLPPSPAMHGVLGPSLCPLCSVVIEPPNPVHCQLWLAQPHLPSCVSAGLIVASMSGL